MIDCKKCLLLEAGESVTYSEIMSYLETIKDKLINEKEALKRLEECKKCNSLISGMCRKCGCYAEVRARLESGVCPDEKW